MEYTLSRFCATSSSEKPSRFGSSDPEPAGSVEFTSSEDCFAAARERRAKDVELEMGVCVCVCVCVCRWRVVSW